MHTESFTNQDSYVEGEEGEGRLPSKKAMVWKAAHGTNSVQKLAYRPIYDRW